MPRTSAALALPAETTDFRRGLWRLADPKISLASLASVALGVLAAAARGRVDFSWLALTVAAVLAVEIAKNASGEVVDFDSGADLAVEDKDRTPFSGGKRVLVDGLLTRAQTAGIAGLGCAYFYHAEPIKLSYRGLGELAVGLCYGPLICCGAYLVQQPDFAPTLLWLAAPLGLLIAAFLCVNEFPDAAADAVAGKKTLAVRWGRPRAAVLFCALVGAAFAISALAPVSDGIPWTVWLGMLAVPFGLAACRIVSRNPRSTAEIVPAQRYSLAAFVVYSLGAGIGLVVG